MPVFVHQADLDALLRRADRAEAECQRLREIISDMADQAVTQQRMVAELGRVIWRG